MLENLIVRQISASDSSQSVREGSAYFIWKSSGDVFHVARKSLHGLAVAVKRSPKPAKAAVSLTNACTVAHQCLQKIGSPQKAALEIWAKCLQSANAAFFLLAGILGKKIAKKENPSVFRVRHCLRHFALKTKKFPKTGALGAIRTRSPGLRKLVLYPAELWVYAPKGLDISRLFGFLLIIIS